MCFAKYRVCLRFFGTIRFTSTFFIQWAGVRCTTIHNDLCDLMAYNMIEYINAIWIYELQYISIRIEFVDRWSVLLFQHLLYMLCTDEQRLRENTYAIIRCTRVYIPIKSSLISTVNFFIPICFLCKFVLESADCVEKVKKTRIAIIFIVHFLLLPTSQEYIQCNKKYNIHVTYICEKGIFRKKFQTDLRWLFCYYFV